MHFKSYVCLFFLIVLQTLQKYEDLIFKWFHFFLCRIAFKKRPTYFYSEATEFQSLGFIVPSPKDELN